MHARQDSRSWSRAGRWSSSMSDGSEGAAVSGPSRTGSGSGSGSGSVRGSPTAGLGPGVGRGGGLPKGSGCAGFGGLGLGITPITGGTAGSSGDAGRDGDPGGAYGAGAGFQGEMMDGARAAASLAARPAAGPSTSPMEGIRAVGGHDQASGYGDSNAVTAASGAVRRKKTKAERERERERETDGEGRRRKVAKACLTCQRSHLTCDERRPCTRCVKKGIGDQCVEGVRKKAKYLLEGEERDSALPPHSPPPLTAYAYAPAASVTAPNSGLSPALPRGDSEDIWLAPPLNGATGAPADRRLSGTQVVGTDGGLTGLEGMHGMDGMEPLGRDRLDGMDGADPLQGMDDADAHPIGGNVGTGGFWNDGGMDVDPFAFGTTASSEYQMLDAMLSSMSPIFPSLSEFSGTHEPTRFDLNMPSQAPLQISPSHTMPMQVVAPYHAQGFGDLAASASGASSVGVGVSPMYPAVQLSPSSSTTQHFAARQSFSDPATGYPQMVPQIQPQQQLGPHQPHPFEASELMHPNWPAQTDLASVGSSGGANPWTAWVGEGRGADRGGGGGGGGGGDAQNGERALGSAMGAGASGLEAPPPLLRAKLKTPTEVYHSVFRPYDYTEGYHFLMDYLAKNFEQREVLKVVRALAAFRPSLIALQMPMSEEDEIFLERSFQRTLLELEKLISYSATPTAVWRRTGEIVYANPEFCELVQRSVVDLLGGRTYIYLLFSKPSVVAYWENFSVHAFENTTQNFFQPSTLNVAGGQVVCSCCFTLRRDVFDLPSVIIGQFLPVPQDG